MSFESLCIDPKCLAVLKRQNIATPTPVQAAAIPLALEGRDVMAIAQTGTGKTLGFGLPALTRLATGKGRNRMLVLTPTRELAQQVEKVLEPHARALKMFTVCIYGGASIERQAQPLRRGCDIVVATPGRLLDHLERGNVKFNALEVLVLDEADRMLDMGFLPDIKRIMKNMPQERQTLMFSATLPGEIGALANDLQRNPAKIVIGSLSTPADRVRQGVYTVHSDGKFELLAKVLQQPEVVSALVFIRTKHRTDKVAKMLHRDGFKAQAIHGGRSQRQRDVAIEAFRNGRISILVATDVAARGLDVQGITHVVNFDIPRTSDDYIHRIGRTARASAAGDAVTFVSPEDARELGLIERALGAVIPREEWEGAVHVASHFQHGGQGRGKFRQERGRPAQQRRPSAPPSKAAAKPGRTHHGANTANYRKPGAPARQAQDTLPDSRRESFHRDHFETEDHSADRPAQTDRSQGDRRPRNTPQNGGGYRPEQNAQKRSRPGARQRRAMSRSRG